MRRSWHLKGYAIFPLIQTWLHPLSLISFHSSQNPIGTFVILDIFQLCAYLTVMLSLLLVLIEQAMQMKAKHSNMNLPRKANEKLMPLKNLQLKFSPSKGYHQAYPIEFKGLDPCNCLVQTWVSCLRWLWHHSYSYRRWLKTTWTSDWLEPSYRWQ